MKKAVELGQRLKVVFFHGQVTLGKVEFDMLPTADLWDDRGCGTSQKGEIATLERAGWEYEPVDVLNFHQEEFRKDDTVDAKDPAGNWRRGVLRRVPKAMAGRDETLSWTVLDKRSGEEFETQHLRSVADAITRFLDDLGQDRFMGIVKTALPSSVTAEAGYKEGRLPDGTPCAFIQVQPLDIQASQRLRDEVLSGDIDVKVNKAVQSHRSWQLQLDQTHFFEEYEKLLLSAVKLTTHQQEKLEDLKVLRGKDIHLSAPAGAGKTFVAARHALDTMCSRSAFPRLLEFFGGHGQLLYVAPSRSLCFHFVVWMITQGEAAHAEMPVEAMLNRIRVLHEPFEALLIPSIAQCRVELSADQASMDSFALAVIDEAHHVFVEPHAGLSACLGRAKRKLILSDQSQSLVLEEHYPKMHSVKLTEVVRNTKRIVTAAAAFEQLGRLGWCS